MAKTIILERFLIPGNRRHSNRVAADKQQRIFILPTRHGLLFATLLLIMLIGSINYDNSLAYMLTFLLASIFMAGILYTYRNLAGVMITYKKPKPVFTGETARFPFEINNESCSHRYSITLNEQPHVISWFNRIQRSELIYYDFTHDRYKRLEFELKTEKRGIIKLGRVRISSTFPLGLFRAWSYLQHDEVCLVYPKSKGTLAWPIAESGEDTFHQGHNDGMDDFSEFRTYRAGDSSRAISWKHYARSEPLLVKRFNGMGSQRYYLRWSDTEPLDSIEDRLSQLTQWVVQLEQHKHLYALHIPGFCNHFNNGPEHQHDCLKQLALFPET